MVGAGVVGQDLPRRVAPEVLVVIQVLVSGGQAEDPLGQDGPLGVGDELGSPRVGDGPVEGIDQAEVPIGLAEQEGTGIGRDPPAGEVGVNRAAGGTGKRERVRGTLCHRGGSRRGVDGAC